MAVAPLIELRHARPESGNREKFVIKIERNWHADFYRLNARRWRRLVGHLTAPSRRWRWNVTKRPSVQVHEGGGVSYSGLSGPYGHAWTRGQAKRRAERSVATREPQTTFVQDFVAAYVRLWHAAGTLRRKLRRHRRFPKRESLYTVTVEWPHSLSNRGRVTKTGVLREI